MKKCKWYKLEFHDWEKIFRKYKNYYLGEMYYGYYVAYRKCKKCGVIQENKDTMNGSYWSELNQSENEILDKHIVKETEHNFLVVEEK